MIPTPPLDQPIHALYALISVDEYGNEGICAHRSSNGEIMPLVSSSGAMAQLFEANIHLFTDLIASAAHAGRKVQFVEFTTKRVVKTYEVQPEKTKKRKSKT